MLSATVQNEAAAPYHLQPMDDPDVSGVAGIPGQGPYMQLFARLRGDLIAEASFQTYSCPNAIACGSWVTRWMEGRDAETLKLLTASDLMRILGTLPLGKEHCAVITVSALKSLLDSWAMKNGPIIEAEHMA